MTNKGEKHQFVMWKVAKPQFYETSYSTHSNVRQSKRQIVAVSVGKKNKKL